MSALDWTGSLVDQISAGYERIAPIIARLSMPERFSLMNFMPKVSNDTPIDHTTLPSHLNVVFETIVQQHTPCELMYHLSHSARVCPQHCLEQVICVHVWHMCGLQSFGSIKKTPH